MKNMIANKKENLNALARECETWFVHLLARLTVEIEKPGKQTTWKSESPSKLLIFPLTTFLQSSSKSTFWTFGFFNDIACKKSPCFSLDGSGTPYI